jgi:hypothetical protein
MGMLAHLGLLLVYKLIGTGKNMTHQHIDNLLIHIEQTQIRTTWQWTY